MSSLSLTDDQREIWLASQLSQEASVTYNHCYSIDIKGSLDLPILQDCLQLLGTRHDALRVTIAKDGRTQLVAARREQLLETVSVDDLGGAGFESRLSERILEPFDFEKGPLVRWTLFHNNADRARLLLVSHHIITDGWSVGVLVNELGALYTAKEAGTRPSMTPAMQYGDYISWLNGKDARAREAADKEYWLDLFRDNPVPVELPADRGRPAVKTFKAGHLREPLGSGLTAKLESASQELGCTLFQFFLASFHALLFRITGEPDIVVGVPRAGQLSPDLKDVSGIKNLVGHCASLLPIRTGDIGGRTFQDLVSIVNERMRESKQHQNYTFSKIAEALDLERDPSRIPIVSVSLNLLRIPRYELGNLDARIVLPPRSFNFFDVTIDLLQTDEELYVDVKYNDDIYDGSSALRWLSQWKRVLEQVIETPGVRVSDLDLLTEEERRLRLETWNSTECDYSRDSTLHSLFECSVGREPDRQVLVFEGLALTYLELERRANRLAHELKAIGAGPETLVGVCLERSPDLVASLLAVLKCGAAYVPIDPAHPSARIAYVLEDSNAAILVTEDGLLRGLGPLSCTTLSLDGDASRIESRPETRLESSAGPDDLAYVIYTSGSTGKPKGVEIPHRAAVNFVQAMAEEPGLSPDDVLLAVTTVSFDIAVLELFLPMYRGARIVLASKETPLDPVALDRLLGEQDVTVMQATPSTWRMMVRSGWRGRPTLKVLCGGEAMPGDLAEQLLPRCGELWNMYGPTETTVWSTCSRVEQASDIHIGRPIANTQVYVLDAALHPVPVGVSGELMIGGEGLARGYRSKPKLTADRFIASPFKPGCRLYRTGDLAKYRTDGSIECLGRIDFQVKIRGFRVELGEIESVLAAQDGIEYAIVVAREDGPGEKKLVAYVKTADGKAIGDEKELKRAAGSILPHYMVPTRIVALEEFPISPSGKIDRKALPAPDETPGNGNTSRKTDRKTTTNGNREPEWPQGEIELFLETTLKKSLGIPRIGRHANFFDIGGDSLIAAIYLNEIHEAYRVSLPLATLFRAGSIAQIASEIESRGESPQQTRSLVAIQSAGGRPKLFCIHAAGGNVLSYRTLSERLGKDYPLYGLQSRGLDGTSTPLSSIEEMARAYLDEIRTVQAKGPYYLLGECLGGIIAYEVAQLLRKEGDEVALLAMLDTYNFARLGRPHTLIYLVERAYFHFRTLLDTPYGERTASVSRRIALARHGEMRLILRSIFRSRKIRESSLLDRIHALNREAAMRYQPVPYKGEVTLFRPKRNYSAYRSPDMGWKGLAGDGIKTVQLDLNPHSMLTEPFVKHLAYELSLELR